MPTFDLQSPAGTDTGYTLQITGASAAGITVKYNNQNSGPWTAFACPPNTATFTTASGGNGTPASPNAGDTLLLSGTFGPIGTTAAVTVSGTKTYVATAGSTKGYTAAAAEPNADPADWAAPSN